MNIDFFRRHQPIFLCLMLAFSPAMIVAKRRAPAGGRVAVVVDERLSALRTTPDFYGALLRRMSRGALVAIRGEKRNREGVVFCRVNISSRTNGWIQRDALVSPVRIGDDAKLFRLIKGSEDFDRIVRARLFLDHFTSSGLRPEVLMIYAQAA